MTHMTAAFIGAGEIGGALAKLVSHTGAHIKQWDVDPKKVPGQKSLEEVVSSADVLFLCVPSWVLRKAVKPILPSLRKQTLCVFVSKGIEQKTGYFMHELVEEILPDNQPFALLSGPMLAEELEVAKGGAACVGVKSKKQFERLGQLFSCQDLALSHAPDVKSVALAGVLKNVYAIALGIASGLEWGENKKGWLCAEVIQEMIAVFQYLKADPSYVLTQAGVGDFIATGMSKYSANHTVGRTLVHDIHCERKSEGCEALPSLLKKLGPKRVQTLPILHTLSQVVLKGKNTKDQFEHLFCA